MGWVHSCSVFFRPPGEKHREVGTGRQREPKQTTPGVGGAIKYMGAWRMRVDGDTEAHADEAKCSGRWHVGLPLQCCRAAPASRGAQGAEGSTAVCHPRSRGLCSKEGNCSGRNLCFNIFFVCLFVCVFILRKMLKILTTFHLFAYLFFLSLPH